MRDYREKNKNRTEIDPNAPLGSTIFLTDTIWTFKQKTNKACEDLAARVKFGSHLYKTVKLGAGYKLEIEHEGKWHELQDNFTFGDYSHLGFTFENSTKKSFNLRFSMVDQVKTRSKQRQ